MEQATKPAPRTTYEGTDMTPTVQVSEETPLWEHLWYDHKTSFVRSLTRDALIHQHEDDHRTGSWRHEHPRPGA